MALSLSLSPAFADGGVGAGLGAAGGTDNPIGVGGDGANGSGLSGGGGGGAGTSGGNGGSSLGGAGGAGGAHGMVGAGLPGSATTGTNGIDGISDDSGGGGGAGGYGLVFTGWSSSLGTLSANVTGGNGGNGGASSFPFFGAGGGSGGLGILFNDTTHVKGLTIDAAVIGGNGGAGGPGGTLGVAGAGGAGIVGSDLLLTIGSSGSVKGGLSGDGVTRADAITFTGGTNTLSGVFSSTLYGNIGLSNGAFLALNPVGPFVALSNAITGNGSVSKEGSSVLLLLGTSTYTGSTTVNAGSLIVDGSIASSSGVEVSNGAYFGGSGTVGTTTVHSGGWFMPGYSSTSATMTVNGNLTLESGSTYRILLSPTDANRANVSGTATISGGRVWSIFELGSYVAKKYTILNATGGVSGRFDSLDGGVRLPNNFTQSLSYDANNVYLDLELVQAKSDVGLPTNQSNVADALKRSFDAAGGIPGVFAALNSNGLNQVVGQPGPATQTTSANTAMSFINYVVTGETGAGTVAGAAGAGAAMGYTSETVAYAGKPAERAAYTAMVRKAPVKPADAFASRWSTWAIGYGGTEKTEGNATTGTVTTTSRIYGVTGGFTYHLSPDTRLGIAMGGAATNFGLAEGLGGGSSDVAQVGLSGRHNFGPTYVAGVLAYGWQRTTTERTVLGTEQLRARFDVNSLSGRLEVGHRIETAAMGVTPYAAGQFTTLYMPSYTEQTVGGSGLFALSYASRDITLPRSELGIRTDKSYALDNAVLTLRGRTAWAHDYNIDRGVGASFLSLPASAFTVYGAAPAHDAALVSAGIEAAYRNGWTLAASFEGEFSSVTTGYAGKGMVRYQW